MSDHEHPPSGADAGLAWLRGLVRRFRRDSGGGIATLAALSMPVMIGATGLAVDVGTWYHAKRTIQSAADAAAFAGALDLARQGLDGSATYAPIDAAARDAADRNGFAGTMTVNFPPVDGAFSGNDRTVEVVVRQPASVFFASLFMDEVPTVSARAVGMAIVADACVWALHPSQRAALSVSGSANVTLGCGVVVNSTHDEAALGPERNSCLQFDRSISRCAGGWAGVPCVDPEPGGNSAADFRRSVSGHAAPTVRPMRTGPPKDPPHRRHSLFLSPGRLLRGIRHLRRLMWCFGAGASYIPRRNGISRISGNAIVSGVPTWGFWLTGSGQTKYAQIDIASGSEVDADRPTSATTRNIAVRPRTPMLRSNVETTSSPADRRWTCRESSTFPRSR